MASLASLYDPEGTGSANYDPKAGPLVANLPQAGAALGSGHLAQDWADYSGNHGLSLVGTVAGTVDAATNGARFVGDMLGGRYGTDVTDPARAAQVAPRAFDLVGLLGAGGMPMAEKGAAGAFGGKLMHGAGLAEDPFAALMAALDAQAPAAAPRGMAETGIADPIATSWRLYHGTGDTWDTFDPAKAGIRTSGAEKGALFMSPRENEAATYAQGDGARVLSLDVTPGNTGVYDAGHLLATRDPKFMAASRAEFTGSPAGYEAALARSDADVAYHQDLRSRMPADMAAEMPEYPAVSNLLSPQSAAVSMARSDGRDTAILRGLGESSGGDQIVALRPGFVHDAATGRLVYSGGVPGLYGAPPAPQQPALGDLVKGPPGA